MTPLKMQWSQWTVCTEESLAKRQYDTRGTWHQRNMTPEEHDTRGIWQFPLKTQLPRNPPNLEAETQFPSTKSNEIKISIWICTTRYRKISYQRKCSCPEIHQISKFMYQNCVSTCRSTTTNHFKLNLHREIREIWVSRSVTVTEWGGGWSNFSGNCDTQF